MNEFKKLDIPEPILKVIGEEKFDKPSEIQEKTIPLVLKRKDVIADAATGSGKTLAFGSAIIQDCVKGEGIQALIITPTRELAEQVCRALRKFSKYKPLRFLQVYGGVSINPQIQELKLTEVVVGTPGRLLDHLDRGTIDLRKLKILVLDEADRMLDMGFIDDIELIIQKCPKKRQTLFFSATIPEDIAVLSQKYMHHPVKVSAESYVDPKKLKQVYFDVEQKKKFSLLVHLLKKEHSRLVMVFCNTKHTTDFVADNLKQAGVNAQAIHGGFSQNRRSKTMSQFHAQKVNVLVCTDVAARGLDIKGISHIYNYDLPKESKQYIHRIGRTARAGKEGKAINILSERDYENFSRIQSDYAVDVERRDLPRFERVMVRRTHRKFSRDSRDSRSSRDSKEGHRRHGRSFRPFKSNGHGSHGSQRRRSGGSTGFSRNKRFHSDRMHRRK